MKKGLRRFLNILLSCISAISLCAQEIVYPEGGQAPSKASTEYSVEVERRTMPYLKLVATDEAIFNVRTKDEKLEKKGSYLTGFALIKRPVSSLIKAFRAMDQFGPPIFNETGIIGNIDLIMPRGTFDFDDALEDLRKNGLDLVKGEKEINVVVVRYPMKNRCRLFDSFKNNNSIHFF